MSPRFWIALVLAAAVTALGAGCLVNECTPFCAPVVAFNLADDAGQPLEPLYGTLTVLSSPAIVFDCKPARDGGVPNADGGTGALACKPGSLEFALDSTGPMQLNLTTVTGETFKGPVTPEFAPTGQTQCTARCLRASVDLELQK